MPSLLGKLLRRTTDEVAIRTGWAQRCFASQHNKIRVLTYHGLIPDALACRAWVPSHYVTVSRFERQMALLARYGPIVPLGEAIERMRNGDPAQPPMVCVTFDDGTADNVELALPILERYGHRATFFLTTGLIDRDEMLPNDTIRLLANAYRQGRLNGDVNSIGKRLFTEPGFNKRVSAFTYRRELEDLWKHYSHIVDPDAIRALRMMNWDEARTLYEAGMEIGAHTVNHVILAHEDRPSRWCEIADSIERVREEIGQESVPFSYPNGEAGDYDFRDTDIMASLEVPYAVTQRPGWNDRTTPIHELRRSCIGLHCSDQTVLAHLFGLYDNKLESYVKRSA